ncbi:hypothetical protein E3N88_04292 [Mikania micrantha]|uniref:Uncharacterized protein n=1 Tax=Mikania micrantha TaxID=192012 RepID=A0A5N6PU12_9ASTR|nr:hypothetical protein E3N88_04292 [Mikania micrantha]
MAMRNSMAVREGYRGNLNPEIHRGMLRGSWTLSAHAISRSFLSETPCLEPKETIEGPLEAPTWRIEA